jgi:hypothetical protein
MHSQSASIHHAADISLSISHFLPPDSTLNL